MICPVCGNQLPDGSVSCNVCGTSLQSAQPQAPQFNPQNSQPTAPQPQFNPQAGQPTAPQPQFNPQAGQPQQFGQAQAPKAAGTGAPFDMSVLVENIKNPLMLLPIIGAVLTLLSAFLPWVKVSVFGFSESGNLWQFGGFYIFTALILILGSLCVVALKFRVLNLPFLEKLKQLPYSFFYVPGLMLVLFLLTTIFIGGAMGEIGGLASVKYTVGWFFALLGLAGITVDAVLQFVKKQDYYL